MRVLLALALGSLGATLSACSDPSPGVPIEADAAVPLSVARDSGSGATFTDLYRDLLGPSGAATCTKAGSCHGGASESGTRASGYICGADKAECRSTLLSSGLLVPGEKDFTKSKLYAVLRKDAGGSVRGNMPKSPTDYVFTAAELDRIGQWVATGAPDD